MQTCIYEYYSVLGILIAGEHGTHGGIIMKKYVKFEELQLQDWFIETAIDAVHEEYGRQMTFGQVIEKNLLYCLEDFDQEDKFVFRPTSNKEDKRFGADGKVIFKSAGEQDGMSCYIDITVGASTKNNVQWFQPTLEWLQDRRGVFEAHVPTPFVQLQNGSSLCFGVKKSHHSFFRYKKPVIVVALCTNGVMDLRFSKNDISDITYQLRCVCNHISFHYRQYDGTKGYGKSASKLVDPNPKFYKL